MPQKRCRDAIDLKYNRDLTCFVFSSDPFDVSPSSTQYVISNLVDSIISFSTIDATDSREVPIFTLPEERSMVIRHVDNIPEASTHSTQNVTNV